jgi:3-oxoacyl-[acyl-carrier protein] reductase
MDLGIAGRKAIVCASSRGLGRACAQALAAAGCEVVINGLDAARLEATATELQKATGAKIIPVRADVASADGQAALFAACPEPDILVNNNAGPPPREYRDLTRAQMLEGVTANMVVAIELIQKAIGPMQARRFGRIVNITSAMVTTPRPHMVISSGPRAGMTAVLKGLALEVAQFNITINNLLPERFDTDRQIFMAKATAKREGITFEEARARQIQVSPAKRLGQPREFGAMCAFLCSNLAGYMSGQNIHLDGAAYPALI